MIEAIADRFEIPVLFVWHPIPNFRYDREYHLFAKPIPSRRERLSSAGYEIASNSAFSRNFAWCADIQREEKRPLYVDGVHFSAAMSELVAECIRENLERVGLTRPGR